MSAYPIERRAANRLPPTPSPGDALGLRGAVDTVLQHGRLAVLVFLFVFGAAAAYLWLAAPAYLADTLLQIDARPRAALLPNMTGADRSAADGERIAVNGEIEVLRSREVLIPVIAAAGADVQIGGARRYGYLPVGARHGIEVQVFSVPDAYRGREFALQVAGADWTLAAEDGSTVASGTVGQLTRFALAGEAASLKVQAAADLPPTTLAVQLRHPVKAYEDVIRQLRLFEPARESSVVRISYEDSQPARAAALLNGLVASYLTHSVQRRAAEEAKAVAYLEQQLPPLRSRVEAAENALSAEQNLSRPTPVAVEADALLRQRGDLQRQLVELRIRRDLLSQRFTPVHPELAAVLAQIATVEGAAGRLRSDVQQLPAQQRDLVRLQREVQLSTEFYTAMLTRVDLLRVTSASGLSTARQLDAAVVPVDPVRPKAAAVLSVGAGAGLALALGAVLLAGALQPTVSDTQELESPASQPTLAVIPQSDAQQRLMEGRLRDEVVEDFGTHRLLVRAAPDDAASESLRSVSLSLMLRARGTSAKVVLITAPSTGSGKAFVAANLAALMAESGKRVLLIEANLRKPGIQRYIGLDPQAPGLSDLLSYSRTLQEVIHRHPAVPMDVMLQGTESGNPGAMLMSQTFESALDALRTQYDHIVINAAPLLPSGDALAVGRLCDVALLVVRSEHSLVLDTRVAQRRLQQAGIRLDGLLFNGVKRKRLNAPVLT